MRLDRSGCCGARTEAALAHVPQGAPSSLKQGESNEESE